ncbi:MAG: FtsL-like putative cell division protein [Candidatus Cyclobacteriaceae bacterium M2_1C_046]
MNKFKVNPKGNKDSSLFSKVEKFFKLDNYFETGIPVKYFPVTMYITLLGILYIANSHYAEKTTRRIDRLKTEVEDLRAEFTTLKANQMFSEKQSEVAKRVKRLGLQESLQPPQKILIREGEY